MSAQTAPLPFKAKFPTKLTPPPKQSSAAEREYLYPHEVESLIARVGPSRRTPREPGCCHHSANVPPRFPHS